MINLDTLTFLIGQKRNDANALKFRDRNSAAIYIAGYTVELALKRKICRTYNFTAGFPENNAELTTYVVALQAANASAGTAGIPLVFTSIRDIRSHDLTKLLFYSGRELHIKTNFLTDWNEIAGWNPEQRYLRVLVTSQNAMRFLRAASIIVREIA